jgi:hypothetical protein
MEQIVVMYYDYYEQNFGDGFYPILEKSGPCTQSIHIKFKLINNYWVQMDEIMMCGLDGNEGVLLLHKLNGLLYSGIGIKNKYDTIIHPKFHSKL